MSPRQLANAPQWHDDPFDSDEDRWPGDRFLHYTWTGTHWVFSFEAIDDSGGV